MAASFKDQLLIMANKFRGELGINPSGDIQDSAVVVLTHVVTEAMRKVKHYPVADVLNPSDATIGALFLCFVSGPITFYLKREGFQIPLNEVVVCAGFVVFQTYDKDQAAKIISNGMKRYKAVVEKAFNRSKFWKFFDTIDKAVELYVVTGDERYISVFSKLYLALFTARQTPHA